MAYQSAFKERLADMESTRNHRLSLLQDEKELQRSKCLLLSAKHAKIRLLEKRCLMLDHKLASDHFKISSLKSEIEFLGRKYQSCAQQLRDLKVEVEELNQLEKEREMFYYAKHSEMDDFKNEFQRFAEEIGGRVNKLKSIRCKSNGMERICDMEAAKMKKSELLSLKRNLDGSLELNKQVRARLQEQLESLR